MRFFFQQQLLVTCQTFREIIRSLVCLVERNHRHRINTCKSGTHCFSLRTKQVHIRIKNCQVERRCFSMYLHLGSTLTVAFGQIRIHDIGPQHTSSAELGNFQEIIGADTKIELDFFGNRCSRNASFGQLIHIFITPCQCVSQFLINISTCIVQSKRIHIDDAIFGQSSRSGNQCLGRIYQATFFLTLGQHLVQIVEVNRTMQLVQVISLLLEIFYQQIGQINNMPLASGKVQLDTFCTNTFKQHFQISGIQFLGLYMERQRINSFVQDIQGLGISFLHIVYSDFLTYQPLIVVFLVTSQIREFTRKCIRCLKSFKVFLTVERFHFKSFVCLPNEFLLKISPLKVCCYFFHPLLSGNRRKVREEFFFTVCHSL